MRTSIIVLFGGVFCVAVCWVCSANNLTTEGDFSYALVRQHKDIWLLKPIPDIEEGADEWPYGLYTLFMSKHGCPSGRWNSGYISFTWQTPHVMLSDTNEFDKEDKFDKKWHRLMSEKTWPSKSFLYGPFSQYKMTLNFCQRPKIANREVYKITWPGEHIRMFDANSDCPKEFHHVNRSLILPPVDTWTENGFLPFFTVDTVDSNKSYHLDHVIKVLYDSDDDLPKEFYTNTGNYIHNHNMRCDRTNGCWLLIDLGRAFVIKAAAIKIYLHSRYDKDVSLDIYVAKNRIMTLRSRRSYQDNREFKYSVQADNDKWSLLRYGGLEISTDKIRRAITGRYLLLKTSGFTLSELPAKHVGIQLLVERTGDICMSDLGMADGSITRNQISSSDGSNKKLDSVRAYNSGWCAHITDSNPYIKVDLLEDTVLDGITIHNWYRTDLNVTNGAFIKTLKAMGIRSFTFTYSHDENVTNNMSFRVDLFRPLNEPETFMFHKQVITRYVRIDLTKSLANGDLCIKFELHGCGKYGGMTNEPNLRYKKTLNDTDSSVRAVQTLRSSGQIANIGFPNSYRDGTTYSWIVDFRNVGYINVVFEKIRLQNVEDRTFKSFWYDCEDTFTIDSKYPCSECNWAIPAGYHSNWIIQTDVKYLVMSFTSCRPYTPRYRQDLNFIALVENSDVATCDGRPGYGECSLSTMFLSTIPLVNRNSKYLPEKIEWNIVVDAFYIRLLITYFHIECSSGTVLKVLDPVSSEVVYTNCEPPPNVLLSESNRLSLIYQFGKSSFASFIIEGFEATYNTVELYSRIHDDIKQNDNEVWRKQNDSDDRLTILDFETKAAPMLAIRDCSSTFKKCYYTFFGIKPSSWNKADEECWVRGLTMVSIRSSEELLLVRSILRTLRKQLKTHTDKQSHFDKDYPEYYLHIGISRATSAWERRHFVFVDGSAMIFSAWNDGEPKQEGDCVRMHFYQAWNSAWEVEECTKRNALYFMCEEYTNHFPKNDLEDNSEPGEYMGILRYTNTRRQCRNIYDISSWETCSLLDPAFDRCDDVTNPYNGTLNVTHTGKDCLRWDSPGVLRKMSLPGLQNTRNILENYCLSLDGGYLWCFTKDQENTVWDYCSLQDTHTTINDDNTNMIYLCSNGIKISTLALCNGIVDCVDGQDEKNCSVNIHELMVQQRIYDGIEMLNGTHFICGSNETISFLAYCDSIVDCIDGTDELNCSRDKTACSRDEFECGDGSCIHTSLMCDFIPHCVDFSDEDCEHKFCGKQEHNCDNGQCINSTKKCDSYIDCIDGSDEENCDLCRGDSFHCGDKKCIDNIRVCDGIVDCNDESDEEECKEKRFPTCEDRWRNGYRKNGKYSLNKNTVAECNFDTLKDDGKVTTTIHNHWRSINEDSTYIDTIGTSSPELEQSLFEYDCQQTFLDGKGFWAQSYYDFMHMNSCTALTVVYSKYNIRFEHRCKNVTSTLSSEDFVSMHSPLDYMLTMYNTPGTKLLFGPIICRNRDAIDIYEHTPQILPCDDHGEYKAGMRCIYDSDSAGVILGCRSGSHLQNCSDFECPNSTVRCPGSFCLPMNYICDGIRQCPGNEDEAGCDCSNDDLELVLFVLKEEFVENDKIIRQIAEQFNHRGAIVRILEYSVDNQKMPITETVLIVIDTEINYELDKSKEHSCRYRLRVSDFFQSVKLSNAKSRGIIFVQNGTKSNSVTEHIFRNMSKPNMDVFRVSVGSMKKSLEMNKTTSRYVTDITINRFDILSKLGSKIFSTLCKDSSSNLCQGNYKCSSSKLCITMEQVCDGHVHCPFSDDEMFCGFVCPPSCVCSGFNVYCTFSEFVNYANAIRDMDTRLRVLDISRIKEVGNIINVEQNYTVLDFPYMIKLNLSQCDIVDISEAILDKMRNLRSLDLSRNKISKIPSRTFSKLSKLVYLSLYGNEAVITFDVNAFSGLLSIRYFDITGLRIDVMSSKAFSGLELIYLNVSGNSITQIDSYAFGDVSVKIFIFKSNMVKNFDEGLFHGIYDLELLHTSSFKYCCVRPKYLAESSCFPEADEFSSCEDLMKNPALQTMLWLMGICALIGNIVAIVYRIVYDRERFKLGFGIFVTNLAVADFFMGVYLLIIAIADASFRKRYIFMDEYWRNSVWCTLAGVLSTISSEASVAFLCLITLDRFIVIKYPFSQLRFTARNAQVAASFAWILSICISVTPLVAQDHFKNMFYAKSGVCVPLPLTRDRPPGWLYSVFVFIGLNFVTFICIAIGQLSIYLEINAVSSKIKSKAVGKSKARRRKELSLARNLVLVVVTDFLCWFPVGCMGIMAMNGYVIPADVYAWVAVFVLPVNSALNPVLYTLMTRNVLDKKHKENAEVNVKTTELKAVLRKYDIGKQLSFFLHREKLQSVDCVLKWNMKMAPKELLKFTIQLTNCIRLLHRSSMVLENLNVRELYVTVEHGKVTGDIQIRQQPKRGASVHDRTENMYDLGIILHRLMTNNTN